MAKITVFMLCDNIENIPLPTGSIVQKLTSPQMCLRPQFVPGNYSFGVAVGIQGIDFRTATKVRFTISDPDGITVQDSGTSEFPPISEPIAGPLPTEYRGFLMQMEIRNMTILKEGAYSFSVYIDDELVGTQIIPVFRRGQDDGK